MRLDEEAQRTEERMLKGVAKIKDVPTLETILREGLSAFEDILSTLSPRERDAARASYLDKVRRVTCAYHLAIVEAVHRKEFLHNPTNKTKSDILTRTENEMESITRLYRFL